MKHLYTIELIPADFVAYKQLQAEHEELRQKLESDETIITQREATGVVKTTGNYAILSTFLSL